MLKSIMRTIRREWIIKCIETCSRTIKKANIQEYKMWNRLGFRRFSIYILSSFCYMFILCGLNSDVFFLFCFIVASFFFLYLLPWYKFRVIVYNWTLFFFKRCSSTVFSLNIVYWKSISKLEIIDTICF